MILSIIHKTSPEKKGRFPVEGVSIYGDLLAIGFPASDVGVATCNAFLCFIARPVSMACTNPVNGNLVIDWPMEGWFVNLLH